MKNLLRGFVLVFAALLTASLAAPAFAAEQAVTTDIGTLDQEIAGKAFPAKPPYSPYADRNFPPVHCLATPTRTLRFQWTLVRSVPGSAQRTLIVLPRERRS
jgi:hypothetical protein